jgi:hypothetical protein
MARTPHSAHTTRRVPISFGESPGTEVPQQHQPLKNTSPPGGRARPRIRVRQLNTPDCECPDRDPSRTVRSAGREFGAGSYCLQA